MEANRPTLKDLVAVEHVKKVRSADGNIIGDLYITRGFVQNVLNLDPKAIWDELRHIPAMNFNAERQERFPEEKTDELFPEIELKMYEARLITGNFHALKYRGNAINRHKVWFQTDIREGYRKYYYTGWQHMIAPAQCDVTAMPRTTQQLMEGINAMLPEENQKMNHGIFTRYKDGMDCIGPHSDKLNSFPDINTWILVIKLGCPRIFEFTTLDGERLFNEVLPAGTAIWCRSNTANVQTKHAVPQMFGAGESGSLVFRNIATLVPWDLQIRKAEKARLKKIAKATERAAQLALSQDEKKTKKRKRETQKTKKRKQEAQKTKKRKREAQKTPEEEAQKTKKRKREAQKTPEENSLT